MHTVHIIVGTCESGEKQRRIENGTPVAAKALVRLKLMVCDLTANFRTRTLSRGGRLEQFGPVSFRIIAAMAAALVPLKMCDLVDAAYGDAFDGGAEWPENSVAVLLVRARAKLARLGLTIILEQYNFGWRVLELDREAAE
jgi:hypothetical protein